MYPYGYGPPPPGSHYPPPGSYPPPPPGYPYPPGPPQQQQQPPSSSASPSDPRPLSALALAAASGLHEMERERERERERDTTERPDVKPNSGIASHPGSTTSTPYGSYDQQGYWPQYAPSQYPVSALPPPGGPPMGASSGDEKHRGGARRGHAPHTNFDDGTQARHSHSHDPSHPSHHVSLSRTQHRHGYAPYAYPSSADQSLANSPASSRGSGSDDSDHEDHGSHPHHRSSKGRSSHKSSLSAGPSGIGMGSQPGAGQQHAIGQLHQALTFGLTPSTSPVLGPLKGLSLMSAQGSRAGSVVHSRASSPIHLPPLKLSSGENSGTDSPDSGAYDSNSGHRHQQQFRQQARSYGHKSQPGSPVYDPPSLSRGSSSYQPQSSLHSGAPPSPRDIPSASVLSTSADRTLPGISSLAAIYNTSNPPSRHNSPPGSPSALNVPGSHFSSTTASSDSLASLGGSYGRGRNGFSMTPLNGPSGQGVTGGYFAQNGNHSAGDEDGEGEVDEGEDQLMEI